MSCQLRADGTVMHSGSEGSVVRVSRTVRGRREAAERERERERDTHTHTHTHKEREREREREREPAWSRVNMVLNVHRNHKVY